MSKNIHEYCNVLGISHANLKDKENIKRKYRILALAWHPDKHTPEDQAKATAKFQAIQEAYEILVDDEKLKRVIEGRNAQSSYEYAPQYRPAMPSQPAEYKFDIHEHVAYFPNTHKPIEIAANAANKKLVDLFEKKTEEIFAEAYKKYKANSEFYYAKYKKSLYDKYVQSKQDVLARGTAIAEQNYNREVKPAKIAFYTGLFSFFLVVPLIATGIGYYFMRKSDKAKQDTIKRLNEEYKCQSQDKWEQDQVSLKTKEQWESKDQYTLEEFILPNNKTDEGEVAQKTYDKLKDECLLKCKANSEVAIKHTSFFVRRTLAEAFKDIVDVLTSYISPRDAEAARNAQAEQASVNDRPNGSQEASIDPLSPEPSPYHQHRPPSPLVLA